jgi:hypothetical protein
MKNHRKKLRFPIKSSLKKLRFPIGSINKSKATFKSCGVLDSEFVAIHPLILR